MKRKWLFSALGLLLIGGICWLLVGITINIPPKSPLQKLNDARALWKAKGSPNYQMDIVFGAALSYIGGFRLIVHDNEVTEIYSNMFSILGDKPLAPDKRHLDQSNVFAKNISPRLKDYSVDSLFEIAELKLAGQTLPVLLTFCGQTGISPQINFDPDLGYIQAYELSSCPSGNFGGGLMCPVIGDCYVGMRVNNFQILPQSN
jgi:hypothetical protein